MIHSEVADGPETTQIVIYAQLHSSLPSQQQQRLRLLVSRFSLTPPHGPHNPNHPSAHPRIPRPDDPTPRQPPLFLTSKREYEQDADGIASHKRQKSNSKGKGKEESDIVKRAREVMLYGSTSTATAKSKKSGGVFKVPNVPSRSNEIEDPFDVRPEDVFGIGVRQVEVQNKAVRPTF
jgi:hypothetical protein